VKRLYRSKKDRVIGGVASGIAEYFDVDPTIIRLVWVLAALAGVGILAYIVAMIIIPEAPFEGMPTGSPATASTAEPGSEAQPQTPIPGLKEFDNRRRKDRSSRIAGIALVLFGGYMLLQRIFPHAMLDRFWPVILVLIGVYLLAGSSKKQDS